MAEKGLLPLAPPMQTMLREGSISYPRVDEAVSDIEEELEEEAFGTSSSAGFSNLPPQPSVTMSTIVTMSSPHETNTLTTLCTGTTTTPSCVYTSPNFLSAPSPAPSEASSISSGCTSSSRRSRNNASGSSRSRKSGAALGTSKVGNFVFHTYCPPVKNNLFAAPPPTPPVAPPPENVVHANLARQIQQEEYLRLQESEVKQNVFMQQLVQDIRARQEGLPEPRPTILQAPAQPSSNAGCYAPVSGLASLNVQQLKEECRRYKVPRSGNKLNLIRHLEPFQKEILKKYVVSAQTSPTVSPAGSHVAMTLGQLNANGYCSEEQSMRHSSSAPQLNTSISSPSRNGGTGDMSSGHNTSPASQWSQQPTAVIVVNQAGQMTLQPATVLLTQQGMVQTGSSTQVAPPPPPPPPPPPSGVLLRQSQSSTPSQQANPPTVLLNDSVSEEEDHVKKVEELERMIVQNIQVGELVSSI